MTIWNMSQSIRGEKGRDSQLSPRIAFDPSKLSFKARHINGTWDDKPGAVSDVRITYEIVCAMRARKVKMLEKDRAAISAHCEAEYSKNNDEYYTADTRGDLKDNPFAQLQLEIEKMKIEMNIEGAIDSGRWKLLKRGLERAIELKTDMLKRSGAVKRHGDLDWRYVMENEEWIKDMEKKILDSFVTVELDETLKVDEPGWLDAEGELIILS
jgi:hypothetical protein